MKIKARKPPKAKDNGPEYVNEVEQLVILFNQFFSTNVRLPNETVISSEQLVMERKTSSDTNAICIQQQN